MKGYTIGQPFYQANIWIKNCCGDPLLLEEFTTKREALSCIKTFVKQYNGQEELECYISHFDKNGFSEYSIDVKPC